MFPINFAILFGNENKIADMALRIEAARLLTWKAAFMKSQGQKMTKTLAEAGQYWILFFPLEGSNICENVITVNIPANQRQILQQWLTDGQSGQGGSPQISKRMLKQKLAQLKPQILAKLESELAGQP